ncbi:MAG: hypothetical protein IOMNBAOH_00967 [Rhodocyclaceae bacterium]|nr:hypothetical protein [Rhodocyclaceae bacterium]
MRVVLDTNVVVSALIWGGTPFRLIQAATAGEIELFTSPVLLAELREVLSREHLAARLVEQRSSVEEAIALYGELAIRVSPLATPRAVPNDADDDHVVAVAVAARADLIVSGDKAHLIPLGSVEGIPIVSPAQAVAIIAGG